MRTSWFVGEAPYKIWRIAFQLMKRIRYPKFAIQTTDKTQAMLEWKNTIKRTLNELKIKRVFKTFRTFFYTKNWFVPHTVW